MLCLSGFKLYSRWVPLTYSFITRWNTSKFVKNTPLRVAFSTFFSGFHLVIRANTASHAWYTRWINTFIKFCFDTTPKPVTISNFISVNTRVPGFKLTIMKLVVEAELFNSQDKRTPQPNSISNSNLNSQMHNEQWIFANNFSVFGQSEKSLIG